MKFKVGDKVKSKVFNIIGIIKGTHRPSLRYAVEFEEERDYFHNCGGQCKENHGFWIDEEALELVDKVNGLDLLQKIKNQDVKNCDIKVYKNDKYQFTIKCGEKCLLDNPKFHVGMLSSDKYTYEPVTTKKRMTVSEICEKLGYDVEIVKED